MSKLFFLLSGENETLPFAELKAILEAEGYSYIIREELDQVVRLEADFDSAKAVQLRSAYTRVCALELFTCEARDDVIAQAADATDFKSVLGEGEGFAVRIRRVKEYAAKSDTMDFERKLGRHIIQNI